MVKVSPDIWQWVLSTVNVDGDQKDKLDKWVSGIRLPTIAQLEEFGRKTHIPIGYFFLKNPPSRKCKLTDFRTINSVPSENISRELYETAIHMENIQEWMREYLIDNGAESIDFVGSLDARISTLDIAKNIRIFLGIDIKWYEKQYSADGSFRHLRNAISDAGILVFKNGVVRNNTSRSLDINEFRAFALTDDYAPLIFINNKDSIEGKLFSLIHELVHIGVGANSIINLRQENSQIPKLEAFCNGATAEILIPIDLFRENWNENSKDTDTKISVLSRHFKCSRLAIARRALDSGFLTYEKYAQALNMAKMATAKKSGGSRGGTHVINKVSSLDRNFFLALHSSVREGKTLYTDAYRLSGTNRYTFEQVLAKVRCEKKRMQPK
jgi:Zn-dependent peptidase ImmA (M78 family)